jgi:hypothetical protein
MFIIIMAQLIKRVNKITLKNFIRLTPAINGLKPFFLTHSEANQTRAFP